MVSWATLVDLVASYAPEGRKGRPPFAVEAMRRAHFMQQWVTLSDPAMDEALHDLPLFRELASLLDESTILQFRHLLEQHKLAGEILALVNDLLTGKGLLLKAGAVVDATLIAAPSSTKNAGGKRDPEMHQSKKGKQWYSGINAHIGVDADSGAWCTPCAARPATSAMWSRPTACSTGRKASCLVLPGTSVRASGLTLDLG